MIRAVGSIRSRLLFTAGLLVASNLPNTSAQTPAGPPALPQFEAASVKPSSPSATRPGRLGFVRVDTTPGRLTARSAYLKELIKGAYGLEDYQIVGGPPWIASAKVDVEGKTSDGASRERLLLMLRALLAERFKLVVHRETKEMAILAMTVSKNGPKFRQLKSSEVSCWPNCPNTSGTINHIRQKDLPSLAMLLTRLGSDRPVVDKTGLTGYFELDVDLSQMLEAGRPSALSNGEMFEFAANAIEDKLGLKLVPTKASVEILVIDRAEKPTTN